MAEKVGIVLGRHPSKRFFKAPVGAVVVDAEKLSSVCPELTAAQMLEQFGCKEIILFACVFHNMCYSEHVETHFRRITVPVYQTIVGSGVNLPLKELKDYI